MKRFVAALALCLVVLSARGAPARFGSATLEEVANAITELDVNAAQKLLATIDFESTGLALERARLSLYVGDCDTASATLATLSGVKEAAPLADLARSCARATAGSVIVEDAPRGLWIRLQDEGDRALVPALSDVAVRARAAIERDLGVVMPRPLRIDLVRDLFSLSAVSGLPLQAAETTGTVAVARWGRVNMISPRAAPGGYPWEDTLAHEITHLALSRATRDAAPLWLQEGLAKRQEIRWRPRRPFDGEPSADVIARDALLTGQSVGVDKLGPSIAMLPSADAASIAFAEVSSFVEYWIQKNGKTALRLLFSDLKGLPSHDPNAALVSVSGYDLPAWILRWQDSLRRSEPPHPGAPNRAAPEPESAALARDEELYRELTGQDAPHTAPIDARERARRLRVSELLFARGAPALTIDRLRQALASDPRDPNVRWRLGRSLVAAGREPEGAPLFQSYEGLESPSAGWFALEGRYERARNAPSGDAFDFAVALDPYLEDAACEGGFTVPIPGGRRVSDLAAVRPEWRALCESARKIPRE
jgi:hypothetical protein